MKSEIKDLDSIGAGMGEGKQRNICRTDSRGEYKSTKSLPALSNVLYLHCQSPQVFFD